MPKSRQNQKVHKSPLTLKLGNSHQGIFINEKSAILAPCSQEEHYGKTLHGSIE